MRGCPGFLQEQLGSWTLDHHRRLPDVVNIPPGCECRSVGFCLLTKCTCRTGHGLHHSDKLEAAVAAGGLIPAEAIPTCSHNDNGLSHLTIFLSPFSHRLNRSYMHSLRGLTMSRWLVLGIGAQCVMGAVVPTPTITPAPIVERQDPNAYVNLCGKDCNHH